ncbi:MAG: tyrosine-type recombinase/integrase [Nonlabens sp.]|uniref:tyrosine-type recombinase/integrase n=1 Tax=Nonlabens sp. TaxID=1888209 RepID=UPI003EF2AD8A
MASVKLILKKQKVDASGEAPIYLRLIKNRKTKFISLGIKVALNEWDEAKQRVKKNHKGSTRLNAYLATKVADAQGEIADIERRNISVSARKLKEVVKGKPVTNFFEYSYGRCEKQKNTLSYSTYRNYITYLKKFETFIGHTDVAFEDITVTMIKDYAGYCGTTLGNNNTTINFSLRILNLMFRNAQKEDLIPRSLFPFDKYKVKKEKTNRRYLNEEQLQALINLEVSERAQAPLVKDMFIFSVFAGGLRFSDVLELKWKHYNKKEQRISKTICKTNNPHSFKIGSTAIDILEKYHTANASPEDTVFPFGEITQRYFKDREYRADQIRRKTALVGQYLKAMGNKIDLPFNLTFHLSRHTFATRALNKGMRIEHVSKLMDHSDIGITQIYAKIINSELDKAVDQYLN